MSEPDLTDVDLDVVAARLAQPERELLRAYRRVPTADLRRLRRAFVREHREYISTEMTTRLVLINSVLRERDRA